ncbi:MAG TPA: xanthine dehydrogenase family protein subunit M [Acidimicrobiia bacterium]|nr:xanthine dehydrogenase family protein subunit M [Acidimicrobiia bacterium]
MKPAAFELHAPEAVDDVVALLAEHGDEVKVLAGGQSLVPMLALRLTRFEHLVDVNRVPALAGVEAHGGELRIGATTRHRAVEQSDEVARAVPLLARATANVGHFQIRNRGTLGGAVAHADPAAEQPAVAVALDAVMEIASRGSTREVPAGDFFQGTWTTALEPHELLTAVRFPVWSGRCGAAVEEVARRAGDFALVGAVCAIALGDGGVERAAIALFGVGDTPVRASEAEAVLTQGGDAAEAAARAVDTIDPIDDLHASAAYRTKVAGVVVRRAIERAKEEATGA